jgi:ribosomal protein S4E
MDARQAQRDLRAWPSLRIEIPFTHHVNKQAPRPSPGPHKLRESLPLTIFLRNRLKYAMTGQEVTKITHQRLIKVDGKVRTDETFPTGFQGATSSLPFPRRSRIG